MRKQSPWLTTGAQIVGNIVDPLTAMLPVGKLGTMTQAAKNLAIAGGIGGAGGVNAGRCAW